MSYSGRTPNYHIPYMFFGDIIDPSEEENVFSIIDNQMYGIARMHSGGNGIIHAGTFSIASDGVGAYNVTLYDTGANYAIEAFINQIYVASANPVIWEGLANGVTYYLYIRLIEGTEEDGSSRRDMTFLVSSSTINDIPSDGILIASVSVNEPGSTTFDTAPAGRIDTPDLLAHMQDANDPHGTTWQQTNLTVTNLIVAGSAIFSGVSILAGNVYLNSGLTLDGIDPSELPVLFSGINLDNYHTHDLSALIPLLRHIFRSPEYADTVVSGFDPGELETLRDGERNIYRWVGGTTAATKRLITQQCVPTDMFNVDQLRVTSKVDNPASENITVTMLDTVGNTIPLTGGVLANAAYADDIILASGGQFTPGGFVTINFDLNAQSGLGVYLGNAMIDYNTSGIS